MTLNSLGLSPSDLEKRWTLKSAEMERKAAEKRRNYWEGFHEITHRREFYPDGNPKTNVVTNWVKYVVDRYLGAIQSPNIQVEPAPPTEELGEERAAGREGERQHLGAIEYQKIAKKNHLKEVDSLLLRDCLLVGSGVEIHGYDSETKQIQIKRYAPEEWMFIEDESDEIKLAFRIVKFPEGSWYGDSILKKDVFRLDVYTSKYFQSFQREGETGSWYEIRIQAHQYKQVPIVRWQVNYERMPLITDAFLSQNDEYNLLDSGSGDDIRSFTDCIMKMWGVDADWVMQNEKLIKEQRILPFSSKEEQDATYLTRDAESTAVNEKIDRIRKHIHIMSGVPDVQKIVGISGSPSGIALKLMFTPMEEESENAFTFLERGFRKRLSLINRIWRLRSETEQFVFEDYEIQYQFKMPVNRIEEWQYIGNLKGVVSHRTQLQLLTDIDDPDKEYNRLFLESPGPLEGVEDDSLVDEKERHIRGVAGGAEPAIGDLVTRMSDAVLDYMVSTGAIDRIARREESD